MFYIVFGDFLNNPLSRGFNSVLQKIPFVSIFDILGDTELEKQQRQRPRFGFFAKLAKVGHQEINGLGKRPSGAPSLYGRATWGLSHLERLVRLNISPTEFV
jgi:hypothetical protein